METRKFSSINAAPSMLGFGGMRLPRLEPGKPPIDRPAAQAMIDRAIEGGITYFDTAWMYHDGESELLFGQALSRHPRESYYLADKMPTWDIAPTLDSVKEIFARQLEKCQTEYFDFYLMHCLTAENFAHAQEIGIYDFLAEKKAQGVIRHLGFSFHDTPAVLQRIVDAHTWDFAQIQLNYADWELQNACRQYDILTQHKLPVVVMEPVRGGALAALPQDAAAALGTVNGAEQAAYALRFVASLPGVMTVLSGMSDMAQLTSNLAVFSPFRPLDEKERAMVERAGKAYRAAGVLPCTGCRYCMDCPHGIDIPAVFAVYNEYCKTGDRAAFDAAYAALANDGQAGGCVACGTCKTHCPQSINIPKKMEAIATLAGR